MKTKRGIELNLNESEFKFSYYGLSFYFSSKTYLNKFVEMAENYSKFETLKFQTKYNIKINLEVLFLIALYKKIEKRGFRIVDDVNKKELTENVGFGINLIMY